MQASAPKMADVARRANVSKSTVSRVINGRTDGIVSVETAARVRKAIDDLGYVVNGVAASLKNHDTRTVGLVLADIGNPFFALVAAGVAGVLQPAGYRLMVTNTGNDAAEAARYDGVLMQQQVDAMIVSPSGGANPALSEAVRRGTRVVLIDSTLPDLPLDAVVVDNFDGAYRGTRHLIDAGHRDIAAVTGPLAISSDADRASGYRAALAQAGIPLNPRFVLAGNLEAGGGLECTRQLLALRRPPSALLVMNNLMTLGALRAIAEAGLRLPDDISLVGFDDMEWYPLVTPPITAIREPDYEIGVAAGKQLLRRMSGNPPRRPVVQSLPTELLVRGSTAPLAATDGNGGRR